MSEEKPDIEISSAIEVKVLRDDLTPFELKLQIDALLKPLNAISDKFKWEAMKRMNLASEQLIRLALVAEGRRLSPPPEEADPTGYLRQAHQEAEDILQEVLDISLEMSRRCHELLLRIDNHMEWTGNSLADRPPRVFPSRNQPENWGALSEWVKFLGEEAPEGDGKAKRLPPLVLGSEAFGYVSKPLIEKPQRRDLMIMLC